MKTLADIQKDYEKIMQSDITEHYKNVKLSELVTYMEKFHKVPALRNEDWERKNPKVIAMYRKLANSRTYVK